ncbi:MULTISPECIES: hypothetical protein [unclassified Spirosoma]|uniref:hypothetical protein n=1 Tax=unclassified Spirosoma TaxID=2621999 RepID=UPI000963F654|nr:MULTISPECIES: hypothetical protein [unclassified Spirosoma]MBN8826838.1 hypothetical protein [Spirosoma sp.]OJW80344.1 MAG: hypothetical protein BGO59_33130 [Spirosoma sp. 48-14]
MDCKAHKFQHYQTDSYYFSSGRHSQTFVETVKLFCERCGDLKETTRTAFCGYTDYHKLPDWAKSITNRAWHLDA